MIQFVQSEATGGGQTVTLYGVTAGNLIVVGYSEVKDASPAALSCSDGTSSLQAVAESVGTYVRWRFFYLLSANAGDKTYTITGGNGSVGSTIAMEFSYTGEISFEDYSNNYADETTSVSSGNLQPSGYSLVLGGAYSYGGGTYSSCQINGVSRDGQKSHSDLDSWPPMWYSIVTAGFDGAATCSTSDAGYWTASAVSFREQTITTSKVVDPDMGLGYDYDSLSDWEAGEQRDLPTYNEIAIAKCRCTGGTADTTDTWIGGWTTDATRYIKIWTDPAEGYRHNGTYQTGNKYRIEAGSTGTILGASTIGFVRVDGLQVSYSGASDDVMGIYLGYIGTHGGFYITNNIVKGTGEKGIHCSAGSEASYVANNIVYDTAKVENAGHGITISTNGVCCVYNNTVQNCKIGFYSSDTGGTHIFINNIAQDCTVDGFYAQWAFNASCKNNCSDISSDAPGDDPRTGEVLFADEDNDDFHLSPSDTVAKGYGLNLYNDANFPFQTDIDGQDRGGSGAVWDIGADEYWPTVVRLRLLLDAQGDPSSKNFKLEARLNAGSWQAVPVESPYNSPSQSPSASPSSSPSLSPSPSA